MCVNHPLHHSNMHICTFKGSTAGCFPNYLMFNRAVEQVLRLLCFFKVYEPFTLLLKLSASHTCSIVAMESYHGRTNT